MAPQPVEPGLVLEKDAGTSASAEEPGQALPALPAAPTLLAAAFRSARGAWNLTILAPLWLYCLAAWLAWEFALTPESLRSPAVRIAAVLTTSLLAWPPAVLAIALAAWEFGRGERLGLIQGLGMMRARLAASLGGPTIVLGGAALLSAILAAGAMAFSALPIAGRVLAAFWIVVPGIPLGLIAAGLLLLAVPGFPLMVAAGAVEEPYPFDAATRGLSYLRARPVRYLTLLSSGLAGALAGTVVFAAFMALFYLPFHLAGAPGFASSGLDLAGRIGGLGEEVLSLLVRFAWPFSGALGLPVPPAGPAASVLAGRAVTAFAAASALSALARTYLLLRWEVDGEPPGSQVRPGEEFRWEEGPEGSTVGRRPPAGTTSERSAAK